MVKILQLPIQPSDASRLSPFFKQSQNPKYPISKEDLEAFQSAVKTGPLSDIDCTFSTAAGHCGIDSPLCLLTAIDPQTGDSLLHIAILAGRIDALSRLFSVWPPDDAVPHYPRLQELLVSHKNHQGDTILHLAVRSGDLDLVIAAYRLFVHDWLPGEERFGNPLTEGLDWSQEEDMNRVPALVFMLTENEKGLDALGEARALGHEEIAQWLERLLERYDPEREREDTTVRDKWQGFFDHHYSFGS
jgi:hypothetical protein